ncbi:MAG: hypothetical protein JJE55_13080 [Flavobacteriaceae bacterium]|nr:hypothetical protein [Flavobacteriaceae bacterium]
MPKDLKIIIFDGSFKTTTFINRLEKGLAAKHQVYIFGVNEMLTRHLFISKFLLARFYNSFKTVDAVKYSHPLSMFLTLAEWRKKVDE